MFLRKRILIFIFNMVDLELKFRFRLKNMFKDRNSGKQKYMNGGTFLFFENTPTNLQKYFTFQHNKIIQNLLQNFIL